MTQDAPKSSSTSLATGAITLAALWLLAGAGFKLLAGTPNDLPPIVRDFPLELGLTYKLAITVELCVGFVALLQPKWAWLPLVGVFAVFDAILVGMLGEESCGCFGSSIAIPPAVMLGIDSVLLLMILLTKPWSMTPRKLPSLVPVVAIAAGVALPWLLDRQVRTGAGTGGSGGGEVTQVGEDGQVETVEGGWLELDVESWIGKTPAETPLNDYIDMDTIIVDGLWVLYRDTCDHCAEHLLELAQTEGGERMVTLVRLKEKNDTEANRVVTLMPEGGFVQKHELPDTLTYVITTPGEMHVENGVIVSAEEGASSH